MSLRLAGTPTRWTLLSIALLISFWVWHAPFHSPPPRPTGYIPAKLYEPEAKACNDHAAAELEDVMLSVTQRNR